MNKLKKLLFKRDPSYFFSSFEDDGITVMVYIPYNNDEKNLWLVKFYLEESKLIHTLRLKREKHLSKLLTDQKVLQVLQDKIDATLEDLHKKHGTKNGTESREETETQKN